jgi:hypothetical protein
LTRPGAVQSTPRDKLRAAISAFAEETQRLAALEAARQRAHSDKFDAQDRLAAAEAELEAARQGEPIAQAYAYARGEPVTDDRNLAEANAEVERQRRAVAQADMIERTLASEIHGIEARLTLRRHDLQQAKAEVILAAAEFQAFLRQLAAAWARLRSLKIIGVDIILSAFQGYAPANIMSTIQASEPLEDRIGWAIDEPLIEEWRSALAALAADADAQLPG